jgi:hypothetical protein
MICTGQIATAWAIHRTTPNIELTRIAVSGPQVSGEIVPNP